MSSTKYERLRSPTHFLKSRGSIIRNNFLEYRTKKTNFLFYALFATNKPKHILNRHFSYYCTDTIYSKSIQKKPKSPIFESLSFLYSSTFSKCKCASRVSSDRIIYFNKNNKLAPNRLFVL